MIEVSVDVYPVETGGLTAALKDILPGKVIGVSTYGSIRPVSVWLEDSATEADQEQARLAALDHDPVFLSIDKTVIAANDTDTATITVKAPKHLAAPVVLVVNGVGCPVDIINGVGSLEITAGDPGLITISLQYPLNRSATQFTIQAV